MAGSGPSSGSNQLMFIKLELIPSTLAASVLWADWVGAGKIIDPTSDATLKANCVPVNGDLAWGGDPQTWDYSEWECGGERIDKQMQVGQGVVSTNFDVVMDRSNTLKRNLEDVVAGTNCYFAVLRQTTIGRATISSGTNASIDVGHGQIGKKKMFRDKQGSIVTMTISARSLPKTIDAPN